MKILIAHNEYQYRGGEDVVVDAEANLLRQQGHDVQHYRRSNHELQSLSRASAAVSALWSYKTASEIKQICEHFSPDIIHAHNTFPLISPSLYWAASKKHIPVVQTLHNFRLLCPQAMFFREGKTCQQCIGKVPWRAIIHKCYRGSRIQSAVTTAMVAQHRAAGTYRNRVALYIALSEYSCQKFIQGGLPAHKIRIKPNFVESLPASRQVNRQGGLFIGRLSEEKGLDVLAKALKMAGNVQVLVVGSGPLADTARKDFGDMYVGAKTKDELTEMLAGVRYLVVPSTGIETFGMVALEAFASGTPVIASRHGGLQDLVVDGVTGLLVNPSDAADLAEKMAWAESHPDQMQKLGRAARHEYEAKYTPMRNYRMLLSIYEEALQAQEDPSYASYLH
jgi:glycosyltransferase involved in cell wall biosynthesis